MFPSISGRWAAGGTRWSDQGGWGFGNPCSWGGLECDNDSIIAIRSSKNGMTGTLPSAIAKLTQLKAL